MITNSRDETLLAREYQIPNSPIPFLVLHQRQTIIETRQKYSIIFRNKYHVRAKGTARPESTSGVAIIVQRRVYDSFVLASRRSTKDEMPTSGRNISGTKQRTASNWRTNDRDNKWNPLIGQRFIIPRTEYRESGARGRASERAS